LRPAALQDQIQMVALWRGFSNWILRYDTAVVFDVHLQVCTRYHSISEAKDFRKLVRSKPVIGVIADVRLQHNLFLSSGQSATIDEIPDHVSNFSDVSVCRDVIAVRQHKSRKPLGIRFERIL
jgi:hypothetical protein